MPKILRRNLSSKQIHNLVGDMRQLAGIRQVSLTEGPGKGSSIAQIWTGSGFVFDVLMDRGMDISGAWYCGASLAWRSPSGDAHPARYDDKGLGWLRTFPGGLVATCGLTQTGAPSVDQGQELGLHGRYTSLPAENVCQSATWEGQDYILRLRGEMKQAVLFGENLVLRREITTSLGRSGFTLRDVVTNEGPRATPHMILYHCNLGYPLLDSRSLLETPHESIEPRDDEARDGLESACRFEPPRRNYREKVYFHHLKPDRKGFVSIRFTNPSLFGGLTLEMRYRLDQLPYFTQWKMLGNREYVCGLEPGNALVLGRAAERRAGRLTTLRSGESRTYEIEFNLKLKNPGAVFPAAG